MDRAYKQLAVAKTVLVNLDGGSAVRGVLYETRGALLHLMNAELLEPGSDPIPMAGSVLIERGRVLFVQVVS
jgi:hypothetical protein